MCQQGNSSFCVAVQIADIAEHGKDRAARVAACEFLQATTLWMIGEPALSPKCACSLGVCIHPPLTMHGASAACGPQLRCNMNGRHKCEIGHIHRPEGV